MKTQPGSPAAKLGLDLEIVFIEDAPSKNKALEKGEVDFVWQTVDELPISMGGYKAAGFEPKAFLQIDWSRGGDACVASAEVQTVEDIYGRKSAMLLFSPDHTVFEFMITNSRLTPAQVVEVRKATQFSPDDFTFGRTLFTQGKIDVACLWEPDVTLALAGRRGAHRLFSTADATELVADVLLTGKALLDDHPEVAEKVARAWFEAVAIAERDRAGCRASDLDRRVALQGRARLRKDARGARLGKVDGSRRQRAPLRSRRQRARLRPRLQPGGRDLDQLPGGRDQGSLRSGRPARRSHRQEDLGGAGQARRRFRPPRTSRSSRAPERPVFTKSLSINFATASSRLTHEAIAIINQQVLAQLQMAGGMAVRIEGNTDSIGDSEENQTLSEMRAKSIVEYLASRGIASSRMVARGNGARNPLAVNATAEGRAMNRRTDILFIRGSKN